MVLKGGHEAPTKPKGRPKKNSIPTTEEIEAEERRLKMEEEEERRGRVPGVETLAHGGEMSVLETKALNAETHSPTGAMEGSEQEQPLLMSETHAAS